MLKQYYVYIMSSDARVLYVGVTSDLVKRVYEHKNGSMDGFTKKYKVQNLVYFEETASIESAIVREKQIKKWRREKKDTLIVKTNPAWRDLYANIS